MAFWKPDPADPPASSAAARTVDDPAGISEFPHLIVNQARVLDYFAEFMANSPTRMTPDYGYEFRRPRGHGEGEYPVTVTLLHTSGPDEGQERTVRAKYVVGADGARSKVRDVDRLHPRRRPGQPRLGRHGRARRHRLPGHPHQVRHPVRRRRQHPADPARGRPPLPDVRRPRRGGPQTTTAPCASTTIEQIIAKANAILHPYTLDVRNVAWHSVYEVGHRLTDRFDDVLPEDLGTRTPRVFITGDACHTHSAKAGQGMNVSMQDGFNLGWKLGHVLEGRSPESLLSTYSAERQVVAKNLIDFDKEWSTLMAKKPEEFETPRSSRTSTSAPPSSRPAS